jgi:NAD(P)-dependent dehydrogenase (short-subunit alcohol dehydrogenase family)
MTPRTVFITGSSSGLGRAATKLFSARGWKVGREGDVCDASGAGRRLSPGDSARFFGAEPQEGA